MSVPPPATGPTALRGVPSTPRAAIGPSDGWRVGSILLIAISLGLHVAALVRAEPLRSANDRSRWATVRALTERGDFRIDPYEFQRGWSTIDQVQIDGNLYSTKPALLPIAAAAISLPVEALTGWNLADDPAPHTRWALLLLNLLPFAAALWAVRGLLTDVARTDLARFLALGTLAFATPISAFLPVFNNHTIAACCCALAAVPLVRIRLGTRNGVTFVAAGLFAALTVCNELPAGLLGLGALAVCWFADRRLTLTRFAPAAALPLALFAASTIWQTGSLRPFYLSYGTEAYEFVRHGRPSYWMNPTGLDAARDGFWAYLFHCTFGHHGLFSLTPIWLLAAWGWGRGAVSLVRGKEEQNEPGTAEPTGAHPLDGFAAAVGLLSLGVLAFYLTRTENYNYGGTSVALRWMIWLAPLWALSLAPLADRFAGRRGFVPLAATLLTLSTASAWLDAPNPWQHPWLMRALDGRGWIDYAAAAEPDSADHAGVRRESDRGANPGALPPVREASTLSPPPGLPARFGSSSVSRSRPALASTEAGT